MAQPVHSAGLCARDLVCFCRHSGVGRAGRSDADQVHDPWAELPVVTALGFDRPTALARAGLGIDLRSTLALVPAATVLLRSGHLAAFGVWCEVARLRTDPVLLTDALAEATADHGRASAEPFADVRQLLLLRRAMYDDAEARLELLARYRPSDVGPLVDDVIVLLGQGAPETSAVVSELLEWALGRPAVTGSVLASAANGADRWQTSQPPAV